MMWRELENSKSSIDLEERITRLYAEGGTEVKEIIDELLAENVRLKNILIFHVRAEIFSLCDKEKTK